MVEFNQGYGQPSVPDPFDVLNGGDSIPSLPFNMKNEYGQDVSVPPGTEYILTLDRDLETKQQRNFETKEPEFWDPPTNSQPKWNVVITGDARWPNGQPVLDPAIQDDDGKRRFYARNQSMRALQEAVKNAGGVMIGKGSVISIKLTGLKNTGKGQPQKLYEFNVVQPVARVTQQQAQAMQALGATAPQQAQPQFTGQPNYAPPLGAPAAQQYQQPVGQPGVAQFQPEQQPAQQPPAQPVAAQPVAQSVAQQATVNVEAALEKVKALTNVGVAPEGAISAVVNTDFGGDASVHNVLVAAWQTLQAQQG